MTTPDAVLSTPTVTDGTTKMEKPPPTTSSSSSSSPFTLSQDIPIFLRKTWAMIDTCNRPDICGWHDEDGGESFVVKDPKRFESEIIPQFFKHSKFTSFVRQLNFYSFRKIKYGDDIRIDPEQEEKTSKYWRFYHEKFRKGHPEWLVHVKRTVSGPRSDNNSNSNNNNNLKSNTPGSSTSATPATAASSAASSHTVTDAVVENQQLKTEVSSLKERIDAMTKNIDQLTTMVQQVTLKQHSHNGDGNGGGDNDSQCSDTSLRRRRPRKVVVLNGHTSMTAYVEDNDDVPTYTHSHGGDVAMPDINEASSIGVHSLMPPAPSIPMQTSFDGSDEVRVPSDSELSDEGFVDQLFTAFEDDDGTTGAIDSVDRDLLDVLDNYKVGHNTVVSPPPAAPTTKFDDDNRPREELMKRLSDALSLLPRNIQELIVDRLVYAITSPQEIQDSLQVARALEEVITASASPAKSSPTAVPHSDDERDVTMEDGTVSADEEAAPSRSSSNTPATATPPPSLPLAAATLAALLSQYNQKQAAAAAAAAASSSGSDIDEHDDEHHHDVQEAQRKSKRIADKSLLIPVHA